MREKIEKYELIRPIGSGGMGEVYLARDMNLHKRCAIKLLRKNQTQKVQLDALQREAERMKTINDRRIPYLIDYIENDEIAALVMEYVEGVGFEEYLHKNAPLEESNAIYFFRQMVEIVAYLHERQPAIIYRDLKPSNFILTSQNELRLLDFGTALEGYGMANEKLSCGTYGYCAPEQQTQRSVTKTVDVYALGAILFYMITGVNPAMPPYQVTNVEEVCVTASRNMCELVKKCCAKEPGQRYQDACLMLDAIKSLDKQKGERIFMIGWSLYYFLLFGTAAYAGCMIWNPQNILCKRMEFITTLLVLCVVCYVYRRILICCQMKNFNHIKREWNLIYTQKNTIGLWMAVMMIFLMSGCIRQDSLESFDVSLLNEDGHHVLIKDGAVFETSSDFLFCIPASDAAEYEVFLYKKDANNEWTAQRYFTIVNE